MNRQKFNQNNQQVDQNSKLSSEDNNLSQEKTPWLLKSRKGGKTIWDWLELLVVPILIVLATARLASIDTSRQTELNRQFNDIQKQRDKDVENRNQQDLLLEYMDKISELAKQQLLNSADNNSKTNKIIATARTISTLRALDSNRKGELIQFLSTAHLIKVDNPIINLFSADLTNANLKASILRKADLSATLLLRANLWSANLIEADLGGAMLVEASLEKASLEKANLKKANLKETKLDQTNLDGANFIEAINIVPMQIKSACNWKQAKFTEEFKQKLTQEPSRKVDCSKWD